tara:strand:+ start:137 stop:973 length:837 start_codon:yes stop_codon:yes gene_type:complete
MFWPQTPVSGILRSHPTSLVTGFAPKPCDSMTQDQQLKAARVAFGRSLAIWRNRNGFSQNDIEAISRIAGSPIHNSQQSNVENAVSEPKGKFWIGFELLNQLIDERDTAALPDALKDRVRDAQPFLTAAGSVATATDLWAMAFGQAALPADLQLQDCAGANGMQPAEISNINAFCRTVFEGRATQLNLSKKKAWEEFSSHLPDSLAVSDIDAIKDMVLDLEDITVNALEKIIKKSKSNVCPLREGFLGFGGGAIALPEFDVVKKQGDTYAYQDLLATA